MNFPVHAYVVFSPEASAATQGFFLRRECCDRSLRAAGRWHPLPKYIEMEPTIVSVCVCVCVDGGGFCDRDYCRPARTKRCFTRHTVAERRSGRSEQLLPIPRPFFREQHATRLHTVRARPSSGGLRGLQW